MDAKKLNDIMAEARQSLALREKSPRVQALYDRLTARMGARQKAWGGDLSVLTPETESFSPVKRRVLAFERVMHAMPIGIEEGDLIAGVSLDGGQVVRCILPVYLTKSEKGLFSESLVHKTPDYATLLEKGFSGIADNIKQKQKELESPNQSDKRDALVSSDRLDRLDVQVSSDRPDKQDALELLDAMLREGAAVVALANRFADLAESMAKDEARRVAPSLGGDNTAANATINAAGIGIAPDAPRKRFADELLEIAEVCRRVPEYPARTLREAIQSFWFVYYAFYQTQTYISNGMLDRLFEPYFERDYINGTITVAQAQELIDCLFLRMNDRAQIDPDQFNYDDDVDGNPFRNGSDFQRGFIRRGDDSVSYRHNRKRMTVASDKSDAINHWGQNVLIGGLGQGRKDMTSPMTYMALNAFDKLKFTSPVMTVRMHKGSPDEYVRRAAESIKTGGGMPYVNNDDIIISAYERLGVPYEDACEYANSNCWETLLQGASNQEMIRGINHLLMVELVLNRGKTFIYGGQAGVDSGDPESFENFNDFKGAWLKQLDYMLEMTIKEAGETILNEGTHGKLTKHPLLSSLMKDCIQNAADLCHGGARYTIWHVLSEAVSNAADAMTAIKRLVFDEKLCTMAEIIDAVKSDFGGTEGEALRLNALRRYPKFGNNIDEVDELAAWQIKNFNELVEKYSAEFRPKIIFPPCVATFSWIVSIGKEVAASFDGRRSTEPIAANMSPVPGSDLAGPTSAINSYLKLDTSPMAAGAPIDLRINAKGLEGDEGTARLAGLIKTFIDRGGNMLTLTVSSIDELRRAMAEPEKYRSLRVRMGGWSAYFVLLSDEHKKIHMTRVEHGLG